MIIAEIVGYIVKRVFVDNGSAIDVISTYILNWIDPLHRIPIEPSTRKHHSFNTDYYTLKGEIRLTVKVGSMCVTSTFVVIEGCQPFNVLLGRPWMISMDCIVSTNHQGLKLVFGHQIHTIRANPNPFKCCPYQDDFDDIPITRKPQLERYVLVGATMDDSLPTHSHPIQVRVGEVPSQ